MGLREAEAMNELLGILLEASMLPLSKKLRERLFNNLLKDFAPKIDIAHAFELISERLYRDLSTFRAIRNDFAHPDEEIDFSNARLRQQIQTFNSYQEGEPLVKVYYEAGNMITAELSLLVDSALTKFQTRWSSKE
jgi:DNA-binding MltR family transcriptional regulator